MKNIIHVLAFCGILSNAVFANEIEISKETIPTQESVTQVEDQQTKTQQNENIHIPLGLLMSALKGYCSGMMSNRIFYMFAGAQTDERGDALLSALTTMGADYLIDSYRESVWHPKSKKDRARALGKSMLGTASGSAAVGLIVMVYNMNTLSEINANTICTPLIVGAIVGIVWGGFCNSVYQALEGIYSYIYPYFQKPSEEDKSQDQQSIAQA